MSGGPDRAGCLIALGISVLLFVLPLPLMLLFDGSLFPAAYPFFGVLFFTLMLTRAWREGVIVGRGNRTFTRTGEPASFWLGVAMIAVAWLGCYVMYLGLMFTWP